MSVDHVSIYDHVLCGVGNVGAFAKPLRWIATAVLAVGCVSGCAVGNFGTIGARVEDFSGGQIIEMHAVGLHLRIRLDDAGGGLGYSSRTYVFGDTSLVPGWHFFHVPLPNAEAVALARRSLGVEISTVEPVSGLTIGYEHTRLRARVPADSSIYLEYDESASDIVKYVQCKGRAPCDPL